MIGKHHCNTEGTRNLWFTYRHVNKREATDSTVCSEPVIKEVNMFPLFEIST